MHFRLIGHTFRVIRLLFIGVCFLWLSQSCFPTVDANTSVKITVKDSTGKALAGFKVFVAGLRSRFGGFEGRGPDVLEEFVVTTDSTGSISKNLHWHDKIDYYEFNNTSQSSIYSRYYLSYPCVPPLNKDCQLEYSTLIDKTTTDIILLAKPY